jgi:hypothetical protein
MSVSVTYEQLVSDDDLRCTIPTRTTVQNPRHALVNWSSVLYILCLSLSAHSDIMFKAFGTGSRGLIAISGIPNFVEMKEVGQHNVNMRWWPVALLMTLPSFPHNFAGVSTQVAHHCTSSAK